MSEAGRAVLITGAARGIGRATAERLVTAGVRVAVADIRSEAAEATAQELGEGALPLTLDVSSRESWRHAYSVLQERWGSLHGLVNNAGVLRDRTLLKMDDEEWQRVIDTHLRGTWLGCQIMQPLLAEDGGAIVNVSSSGRHGAYGQTNYSAAKAGIVGLTKTVAMEFARYRIRANCVAPGAIETEMTLSVPERVRQTWLENIVLGRLGQPEEIAKAVVFLLSEEASYITAQVLDVNGGELHA
ncbi:SDR family oxidoreductase [Sediminivirga luteola]|uniref:3-oxoacyl-ACP reductase n=1 Tax=Sediminivirga luteola TaxID=1774748 RepID=A0A8J2U036_9MICO|nr:SDR family NAD(P)-dependent oxidoreductase [Sediminivirga luteola]GGA23760.1 3-oxoacyl-ACP reductase [Sediminivirga luteola]